MVLVLFYATVFFVYRGARSVRKRQFFVIPVQKKYKAFLFDVDGTLIDTISLIHEAFRYTLAHFGYGNATRDEIFGQVGQPLYASMAFFFPHASPHELKTIMDEHMRYQLTVYKQYLRVYPHAHELLGALKNASIPRGIVTSRRRESLDIYLGETGLAGFFDVVVTPECTERHKPDPQPALLALSKMGINPSDALMIGDSSFDIDCGDAAGTDTCFVQWSYSTLEDLNCKPTFTIDYFSELISLI